MTVVRIEDTRAAGLCARGCRLFFTTHGLDWNRFLAEGMTDTELRTTGSMLCERAIVQATRREAMAQVNTILDDIEANHEGASSGEIQQALAAMREAHHAKQGHHP